MTADCSDELLDRSLDSFTTDYPDYAHNKYMSTLSRRERLIYPAHHKAPPPAVRALFIINNAVRGNTRDAEKIT